MLRLKSRICVEVLGEQLRCRSVVGVRSDESHAWSSKPCDYPVVIGQIRKIPAFDTGQRIEGNTDFIGEIPQREPSTSTFSLERFPERWLTRTACHLDPSLVRQSQYADIARC